MADEPDLSFDIDALFDHMVNNLGHDLNDEKDWSFSFRSDDVSKLEEVAHELQEEFIVQIQEEVEEVDVDGESQLGPPLLSVVRRAALSADEVRSIAGRMSSIASEHGLVYEGVSCYDPIDEDELFGWIAPEDAAWRLRHLGDCGLEENADLPWAFLVVASDVESLRRLSDEFASSGFEDRQEYEEPDEAGDVGMCVFVSGRNNEAELAETASEIDAVAQRCGGRLVGIQFYTREDVNEIFGDEEP